jgi:dTDP-glucose 4,6-dehydratase
MITNMALKVLVTGGCGFIGSNFIQFLVDHTDYTIVNIDLLTYAGDSNISWDSNRYTFYRADIGDATIAPILATEKPDVILNFAAETHVDRSITNPDSFVNTNLLSTYKFICMVNEYAKTTSHFRFIHISTDEVYGDLERDDAPFTESSPYLPNSPYSATKAGGDHLVRAFTKTFGLPAIITHCSNNYGPRQFPEKLIPTVIRKAVKNESIPVYGTGLNIRDWLYVDDHCRALYRILLDGVVGSVYNIGGNSEHTNIDVVKTILHVMNKDISLIQYVEDRKGHDFRYAINTEKIEKELGWRALTSFEDGIYKTVEWYLSNIKWVTSCVNLESF